MRNFSQMYRIYILPQILLGNCLGIYTIYRNVSWVGVKPSWYMQPTCNIVRCVHLERRRNLAVNVHKSLSVHDESAWQKHVSLWWEDALFSNLKILSHSS